MNPDTTAIVIDTPRLALREFAEQDAPFVLRLLNEPSFHEFIGDRGVRTLDDARRYLREGPMVIGMCGLVRRDTLPLPDLGFALLPAGWGSGIATEAGRAVLAHGRDALGLTEVLAITSPDYTRSMRVLAKLDMTLEDCRPLADGADAVNVFRTCLR